jgi:hypothetical protein
MSKITIKIIDIDRTSNNIIVKYASEASAKPIDEYSAMGFQITDTSILTPEQFVESIRYEVSQHVAVRDALEAHTSALDFSAWSGYTTEVDASVLVASAPPVIDALATPEVVL